ncbi:MAG: rhodanese-like domain-containing protein [Gammaproteobacteria bacterium]|nr:rhodanese-like domain-containing protein [Gammaproteobacteria bacterium]NIR81826.1 rhodanese-like domain-containing protein [Gammaproteobacteria bacterium]NIR88658.1 rhodanese-like domain-containing protein [Gammaproteobacteria bacterium]NIU02934.1 rhodanese-like domain-containing protein [Gammaproteobacteria bacterium]NIV50455.1 rhodanese-like domain-containing protein [Gammaproteobacteria bacterium]
MAQLLEFLANNWTLTLALVVIVGMLLWTFVPGGLGGAGVKQIDPTHATRLINHENAVVVDIRSEAEFSQGHVLNAVHLPLSQLSENPKKLEAYKDRPVITLCRTGQRAPGAAATLRKQGFDKVYALKGGLLAWQNANLPLVKK